MSASSDNFINRAEAIRRSWMAGDIKWSNVPCTILASTTPEDVLIRIGCACNAAHDSSIKYTFGEKLNFAVQVARGLNISRSDVINQSGMIPKIARKLDYYYNSSRGLDSQIQTLKNLCNALFLPDKAVQLIVEIDKADISADPQAGRFTRLFNRDILVKADGPWYWLADIDDELCVKLAEDVQEMPFQAGEKSKQWRERVYLKHVWRGFLVKNLWDALDTTPPKAPTTKRPTQKKNAAPTTKKAQGMASLVGLVSEGKFDLSLEVLKVDGFVHKTEAVNQFLQKAASLGLFDEHCDLSRMSVKVKFIRWVAAVQQKALKEVWLEGKAEPFELNKTTEVEEEQVAEALEEREATKTRKVNDTDEEYFRVPWNQTPTHFGVFDSLESFSNRVNLTYGGTSCST